MSMLDSNDLTNEQIQRKIDQLTNERRGCLTKARKILAKATVDDRELNAEETRETNTLADAAELLGHKIENYQRVLGGDLPRSKGRGISHPDDEPRSFQPGEYRSLGKNESLREHLVETGEVESRRERLSIGKAIVGLVTGRWDSAERERRALSGSNDTAGGYMLNGELSSQWIDLARSKSVMVQAGVRVVPMKTASLSMLRVTGDPTPEWRGEGDVIASSDPTFGGVNLNAKSLAVMVPVSKELLADAVNAADVIESVLVSAMAVEFDRAVLDGDGVRKPRGIRNDPNVGTLAVGGAASTLSFAEAVGKVLQQNETPGAIVLHPRTYSAAIDRAIDSTGQPLRLPPSLERMPFLQTTSVPANLSGSNTVCYVGDFSQVVVGLRQNIEIAISTQGQNSNGRGYQRNEVLIAAILRADSLLVREKSFVVMTGVTN